MKIGFHVSFPRYSLYFIRNKNSTKFPKIDLKILVSKYIAIPASSSAVERMFSDVNEYRTPKRSQLSVLKVEKLTRIAYNERKGDKKL